MARKEPSNSRRRRPRGGFGWLILFFVIAGVIGGVIYKPDLITGLFGDPKRPADKGKRPVSTSDESADVGSRDIELESRGIRSDATGLRKAPPADEPKLEDKTAKAVVKTATDDTKAAAILDEAEEAYRGYKWAEARSAAQRAAKLNVSPAVLARIEELERNSKGLEELFVRLGADKEELMRNLETHPSLLFIQYKNAGDFYVPLRDFAGKTIIESEDPAADFSAMLKRAGKAPAMNTKWITAMLEARDVTIVKNADVETIVAKRRELFDQKLGKMTASVDLRGDPMSWYSAARFAYQNRLDDRVVELLEEAWIRDHDLATTIREDKARDIYLKMITQLDNNNRPAAGAFMAKLRKQYGDTTVFGQAEAHYKGNLADLKRKREEAQAALRRKREESRRKRLERARKQKDQKAIEEIQQEERVFQQEQQRMTAATGDMGKGDEAFNKGMAIYRQASGMAATDRRDTLYAQAQPHFEKAMAIYSKLGAEDKAVKANQFRYACIKMRRPF